MEDKEKTRLNVLAYANPSLYGDFAKYLRESLSTIDQNTLIPFKKELEK